MRFWNLAKNNSRVWVKFSVALASLGMMIACAKNQPKTAEEGPRIVSASMSRLGSNSFGVAGEQMYVSLIAADRQFSFAVQPTTTGTYSQPQVIDNVEYVMQAMCVDMYCDRVALLLTMAPYGYRQGGYGYGGSGYYATATSSKGFLLRRPYSAAQGGVMELIAVTPIRNYSHVSEALRDLGAYY
jgi:hypothetical protein